MHLQSPRLLLVDDHAVVRHGYRCLLENANIQVVAEADTGEDAITLYATCVPDVVVMDVSMPQGGGFLAAKKILSKYPRAKILMFSMHDDAIFPVRAIESGAIGYVTKSSAPKVLVEAVWSVYKNQKYISPDIAHIIAFSDDHNCGILNRLSDREFEVFRLLAKGCSLDEIAGALSLDYKTIANAQTRLKNKLQVENTAQLVLLAVKLNLHNV